MNAWGMARRNALMRRIIILLAAVSALSARAQVPDWENPAVLGINKLPYHATLQLPSREKESEEIMSLDGQWRFHWSRWSKSHG